MTLLQTHEGTLQKAVDQAVGDLVRIRHRPSESFVHIPLFYPSGAGATLSVTASRDKYLVSDLSGAYQEAAMIGAHLGFVRRAKKAAEKYGLSLIAHCLGTEASLLQLPGAISDVAAASTELAHQIIGRAAQGGEKQVSALLFDKLTTIFGSSKVLSVPDFVGASSREWDITALVLTDEKRTIFKAVGNSPQSVYYASAALHDIALLSNPPRVVSVVDNVVTMGSLYNILAQAGDVMETASSNDAFLRVAA